jgi:hypothetical protein
MLMKTSRFSQVVMAATLTGLLTQFACGQNVTQSFNLQAGWNSVYLEVQPTDNSTATLFANQPVASVWARAERISSTDFIQDASEATFNRAGWLAWFPPSRPEAFVGNLFAVQANRAYLIKANSAFTLTLSGRPSARQPGWVPDKYNLRGFPVNAAAPPTFKNFFRYSAAHFDVSLDRMQGAFRLGANGQWTAVANSDALRAGEAYWIFSKGASDYSGPLGLEFDTGNGLDYGLETDQLNLGLRNRTTGGQIVTIRDLTGNPALGIRQFSPTLGAQWPPLASPFALNVNAGSTETLRLSIVRGVLNSTTYETTLEITDTTGTRHWLPVSGARTPLSAARPPGTANRTPLDDAKDHAGLWVGSVSVNAVSEAHSANPANPTPTKSEFNLRLLVHVDAGGQSRLLKQVIQMWKDGTYTNNPSGSRVQATPGRYVLLTDDRLISRFQGAAARDGTPVGRRISTVGFDFPADPTNNFLALSGFFAVGQSLAGLLGQEADAPTNPFKHKYHPDHDNLTPRFDGPVMEAYDTVREIELEFSATPPAGTSSPDYGYNVLGGTYRETIYGLHKADLYVRGTFLLTRLSTIAELNPNPAP